MRSSLFKNFSIPLSKEKNILELACGTGHLSYRLSHRVRLWEATDFSKNMIQEAKKNNLSSKLFLSVQDAMALPYAPETFVGVMIVNALHIMPDPDAAMGEIYRVLKPGGLLFAPTFVHGEGAGYRLRIKIMEMGGFKTYHKWSADEFVKYIHEHGFTVKEQAVIGSNLTPLCCVIA